MEINKRESDTVFLVENQDEIAQLKAIFPSITEYQED
jgi:hypothetical protein